MAQRQRVTRTREAPTRERLVGAATELLERGGYAAAPVTAIAERAGVATGALYRHFPSKAELFVELFRRAADHQLDAMRGAAAGRERWLDKLDAVIGTYAASALARPRLAWALVYEPVDPLVDAERLTYRRLYREGMTDLLRQGIAAGEIPDQDADFTAAAVVGAIAEVLVGPLSPLAGAASAEPEIVARVVGFCRRAVGAEAEVVPG
jgi:AcrR family transcriptional regulator